MNRRTDSFPLMGVILVLALSVVSCGTAAPQPKPTDAAAVPTFEPTLPQRTVFPTPTTAPSGAPTVAATATTQTLATLTPIRTVASGSPSPTAISSIAPGLYATNIRLVPARPISGGDPVVFHVTFVNTTSKPITFKWRVKIWSPNDSRNAFGDTTILTAEIQPGTTELASGSEWKTNPGPCTPFYARVYNVNTDVNADPIEFKKPDGSQGPKTDFNVCPP